MNERIRKQEGIKWVHDLHVWCITPTKICALSCHIVVKKRTNRKNLTTNLIAMLRKEFDIDHTTIQLEDEGYSKAVSEH